MEWADSEAADKTERAYAGGPEGSGSPGHLKGAGGLGRECFAEL